MIRAARTKPPGKPTRSHNTGYVHVSPAAERIGRAIALHLEAGRYGVARRVLDRAIQERERPAGPDPIGDDEPLAMTGLAPKMVNLLERFDITTVADLDDTSNTQLRRIPRIGNDSVKQIRAAVDRARRGPRRVG